MALTIKTNSGNRYTYIRQSNEIIEGEVREEMTELAFNERPFIRDFPDLSVFTLGITTKCNLRCTYCCYSGAYRNTRTHGTDSMSLRDITPVIEFAKRYARKLPVTISFYGGESLLEFGLIKEFAARAQAEWQGNVKFELSTNGTLLSPQVADWIIANDVTLLLSLDGSERVQNRQRVTASGSGSFSQVARSLQYIRSLSADYFQNRIHLLTTVVDVTEIPVIAEEWFEDVLLREKLPIRISTVAPNYAAGVSKINVGQWTETYMRILEAYGQHPEHSLIKVFFERFLAEWVDRPIFSMDSPSDLPTCVPYNRKVYVDAEGMVGICEKVPDKYRIGSVKDGIDWQRVNKQADALADIIRTRCTKCPVARLCSICPQILDLSEEEMDVFCHNEMAIQQVKLRIFCEMAERGMI